MQLAEIVFDSLVEAVNEEIERLLKSHILLRHCRNEKAAGVLNRIFQENTIRYVTLRKLYEGESNEREATSAIRFDTEVEGPIDLVLEHGSERYAFELKRWQTDKEKSEIVGKDLKKLIDFMHQGPNH